MYYPQSYKSNEEDEEEVQDLDVTLYDQIESQWLVLSEASLISCSLSISISVALLLRAFGATPVVFATLGIVVIITALLALINWSEMRQSLKTRLFLCLLAASVATAIATADTVVDWIKVNPAIVNRITISGTVFVAITVALILVIAVGKVKSAR